MGIQNHGRWLNPEIFLPRYTQLNKLILRDTHCPTCKGEGFVSSDCDMPGRQQCPTCDSLCKSDEPHRHTKTPVTMRRNIREIAGLVYDHLEVIHPWDIQNDALRRCSDMGSDRVKKL